MLYNNTLIFYASFVLIAHLTYSNSNAKFLKTKHRQEGDHCHDRINPLGAFP
jgi:hypothetical protein